MNPGILSTSIDLSKVDKSKVNYHQNGSKYLKVDVYINEQPNEYGQNVSLAIAQTKEEREAKVPRIYLGYGKVVWEKENAAAAAAPARAAVVTKQNDDLPF